MSSSLQAFAGQTDPDVRKQVARRWLSAAQAEHASIASFNRFSLQLLAVGAPGRLVERCQRAALEETHHARLCFGIASVYHGAALGPGELPMTGLSDTDFSFSAIVRGTIEEGCIGETLAAIDAEAARDAAAHPQLREVLETIRLDETAHAEFAFEAVAWALERAPTLRNVALVTYDRTLQRHRVAGPASPPTQQDLARHGLIGESQRRSLREKALPEILLPAKAALLGGECGVNRKED